MRPVAATVAVACRQSDHLGKEIRTRALRMRKSDKRPEHRPAEQSHALDRTCAQPRGNAYELSALRAASDWFFSIAAFRFGLKIARVHAA